MASRRGCVRKPEGRRDGSVRHGDVGGGNGGNNRLSHRQHVAEHSGRKEEASTKNLVKLWAEPGLLHSLPNQLGGSWSSRMAGLHRRTKGSQPAGDSWRLHGGIRPVDSGELAIGVPSALFLRGHV